MKLLCKIMFDGKDFAGFQVQPDSPTVQGELCRAFSELFGMKCDVTGCSRTDSGVHATCFVAAVTPADRELITTDWCRIPPERVHRAANILLPDTVAVRECAVVDDGFHPRYDVKSKKYIYKISDSPARDPFLNGRAYELGKPIPEGGIDAMNRAAKLFVGHHDFHGFMATGSKITDAHRTVMSADVYRDTDGLVCFAVSADGFLYNMVRIMAGTLIAVGFGQMTDGEVADAIAFGDRQKAGSTAPACGLYLSEVTYNKEIHWACK